MAWRELTNDVEEQEGEFALPVPQDPEFNQLQQSLFEDVKSSLQQDPDPRFARLRFGPSDPQGGGALPEEQAPTEWRELEPPPSQPKEPEPDSIYQRMIYGMERGGASLVQSVSIEKADALRKQIEYLEENPELQQQYARSMRAEDPDPERFMQGLRDQLQEQYTAQDIRRTAVSGIPVSESMQKISEAETLGEAWDEFKKDWVGVLAEVTAESFPVMGAGLAAGMAAGPLAAAPVLGMSSAIAEGGGDIDAGIQGIAADIGADLGTTEGQEAVAADPRFTEMMDDARKGGYIVGAFDTVAGLLPGINILGKNKPIREAMVQTMAQMASGAGGEASKQVYQEGEVTAPGAVMLEAVAEGPLGLAEVLASTAGRNRLSEEIASGGGPTPGGRTTPLPETDIDPVTGKPVEISPDVQAETEAPAFDVPPEGFSEAERVALEETLDAQAEPQQGELPLPTQEGQAPTPTETPTPETPASVEGAPIAAATTPPVEDEVVTADDLVTEPIPPGEPGAEPTYGQEALTQEELEATAEEAAPVETPMIERKSLEGKFRELNKKTKEGMPGLRKAVRELGTAIQAVFPDAKNLPSLKGTIGPKRMADFFATLDEEIVIDETLPNLKGYLEAVLESPDAANAIQNINTLKDYVANSGAGVVQGEATPVVEQASRGLTAFDAFEAQRQQKRTQQTKLAERAVAVDELATVVSALTEEATTLGINVPAEVTETIRRARSYRESSQVAKPRTLKGGAGATVTPQRFSGKNLTEVGGILRGAAQTLAEQIAAVDTKQTKQTVDKPKKAKAKVKAEERSAVTEAPAKPKKAEKAKKVPKQKAEKKKAPKRPRKIADPEKVIEVEPGRLMTGKQAGQFAEAVGVETGTGALDRALEDSGISKKSASTVKQLINKADEAGQRQIIQAIKNYRGPEDNLNLVTVIEEALGGQVAPQNMMEVLQFVEGMAENRGLNADEQAIQASEEALAEEAAAQGMSLEDYKTIMEETGQYSEQTAEAESPWSDTYHDMSTDEWENSQWVTEGAIPQGAAESGTQLFRALTNVKTGLLGFMSQFTKIRGMPDPGPTNVNDLLNAIVKALPSNNRYVPLAKRLLRLNLDVPVYIYDEPLQVGDQKVLGAYYPGNQYDPADRNIRLYVGEARDPRHIFATALHEIVHAATIAGYKTDIEFQTELNALYDRAVLEMDRINPNWRTDGSLDTQRFYGMTKPTEFVAEAMTNPEFQKFLSEIDSINNRAVSPLAKVKGLMRDFLNAVKKYLGYSIRNSLLEDVILLADSNLQTEEEVLIAQQRLQVQGRRAQELAVTRASSLDSFDAVINKFDVRIRSADKRTTGDQDSRISAIAKARREVNQAKELVGDARNAESQGKWETATDLKDRAAERLRKAKSILDAKLGREYSIRISDKGQIVQRLSFEDINEATQTFNRLRREGKSVSSNFRPVEESFKVDPTEVSARNDILDANKNINSLWRNTVEKIGDTTKTLAAKANLGLSNLDVMERDYRSLFNRAAESMKMANPLTVYTKAKSSASVLARKYERQAYQMLKKLQKVDNTTRSKMEAIMRDVTMSNIDPTQPLNSLANKHLWTKGGKKSKPRIKKKYADKAPKARQNWINFQKANPEAASQLQDMAGLTREIHNTKVRASLFALGEAFQLKSIVVKGLQAAKNTKDIDAVIPPNEVEVIEKQIETSDPTRAKVLKKILAEAETRAEVAKSAKRIISESTIDGWYFPLRRYGDYVVSTASDVTGDDRYVSFHATKAEAKRIAAALNEQNPDNPVDVSLKITKASSTADVKSVIGDLQRRFKGDANKATRDRLKAAMAEVLASNAAYQSQLKRANVDGVAASDMARGFEEYVHVSKYTIGDLLVSHKIADAINNLNTLEAEAPLTNDERVKLGRVVNEIKDRNNEDAKDRIMSPFQRTVGLIGFFNFLGAPSYWALNATQTYTVTLPYITAKFGVKAPGALAKAQGTVLNAVGKALTSKDKSYEGFKAQLPPAARKVVEALEAENIIQSTIAHEFGDMLSPNAMNSIRQHALGAPVAKTSEMAVQIMEKVPEAVEHYNRISTALAIYNLSGGNITATVDGVQATQFNYDTGNRARLLKTLPKFLGGGGRPLVTPIMMFKTYGIGIARLLYGSMIDTVYKEGGRLEAAKLTAGLITSHTLFGGVAGGLMMAPIMAIQAVANAVFREAGDEWDLEEGIEEWSRELGNDFIATAARRGIPAAALNIDMSRSINLGNLMWMSDERLDPAKYGDAEQILVRNIGGPITSYGISAWRAGAQLVDSGFRDGWSEFAEAAVPIKAYRGVSQAIRYNTEGIETRGELEFVPAEDFSSTLQTMLGFQATQKTAPREEYYSEQARLERRSGRKAKLLQWANEAIRENDMDSLGKVMDDIESFNESIAMRPEDRQYRVTARDLAVLRSRRRTAQREYDKKFRYSD